MASWNLSIFLTWLEKKAWVSNATSRHWELNELMSCSSGTILDDEAQSILGQGKEIKADKPRKEDIVSE